MRRHRKHLTAAIATTAVIFAASACGSESESATESSSQVDPSTSEVPTAEADSPGFPGALGEPVAGYTAIVDLAPRIASDGSASTYAVEQAGTIRLVGDGGAPGALMADLTDLTRERGEQGLLGLAFSPDGSTAYVNYTDRDGNTTVDVLAVNADGSLAKESRRTIYTLEQPYRNHNGGDLIVSPDGLHLFVFNGDGGSADDPDRYALDPNSQLGKIVRIDLGESGSEAASIWSSGLRNPWRAHLDPETEDLWVADVGQNLWEEISVVPLADSEGASFGWSAYEGTEVFNEDQMDRHASLAEVTPVYTYPHENGDCSISGGSVYRGTAIPSSGTWYVFSDFCSGNVRALCVTEERTPCGVVSLGTVEESVAVLPDANGELWVLSLSGRMVPIVAAP